MSLAAQDWVFPTFHGGGHEILSSPSCWALKNSQCSSKKASIHAHRSNLNSVCHIQNKMRKLEGAFLERRRASVEEVERVRVRHEGGITKNTIYV